MSLSIRFNYYFKSMNLAIKFSHYFESVNAHYIHPNRANESSFL
jgi:hypothetical protein